MEPDPSVHLVDASHVGKPCACICHTPLHGFNWIKEGLLSNPFLLRQEVWRIIQKDFEGYFKRLLIWICERESRLLNCKWPCLCRAGRDPCRPVHLHYTTTLNVAVNWGEACGKFVRQCQYFDPTPKKWLPSLPAETRIDTKTGSGLGRSGLKWTRNTWRQKTHSRSVIAKESYWMKRNNFRSEQDNEEQN